MAIAILAALFIISSVCAVRASMVAASAAVTGRPQPRAELTQGIFYMVAILSAIFLVGTIEFPHI